MLAAHMTEAPRAVGELRPDTPAGLEQLVMRCLEKDPASRPQSGRDIAQSLDALTSTSMSAMPAGMLSAPGSLSKTLAAYGAALFIVAIVSRASVIALGLPDWAFWGAVIVMLFGLPVILFTWFVGRTMRRIATTTPAHTPGGSALRPHGTMATIALKASPHLSWRRAWLGGAWALGAFAVLVVAFVVMRAMGVGPAASLFRPASFPIGNG